MSTYLLQGFVVQYGSTGLATNVATSELRFTVGNEAATFGYTLAQTYPDNLPDVYLITTGTHRMQVQSPLDTGGWWRLDRQPGLWLNYEVGTIYWAGNATQVLRIADERNDRAHTFFLAGAPLPPLTTLAQVAAFDRTVQGANETPPAGGFAAGAAIDITALPGITSTEDDQFFFSADFTTPFDAGPGDDLIEIRADQTDVAGGAGTDTVHYFDYNFYEFDVALIDGGIRMTNRWSDHILRDDVETVVFQFYETYSFAELLALIPGDPQLIEGDSSDNLLQGGNGRDTLYGHGGNDHLIGAGFEDILYGGAGDDLLDGGAGYDTIYGGSGADHILAGEGWDAIYLGADGTHAAEFFAWNVDAPWQVGTDARVSIAGLNRFAAVTDGGDGEDGIILTDQADAFFLHDSFSAFHDSLTLGADRFGDEGTARFANIGYIDGGAGDDVLDLTSPDYSLAGFRILLDGGAGNDLLWGSDSDDDLNGGAGDDTLFGGSGSDILIGGAGADRFEFTRSSTDMLVDDFDGSEGDTLVFFNRGGATFDADSVTMTDLGFTIDYADADSGQTQTLTIQLATATFMMNNTLQEITDALQIV